MLAWQGDTETASCGACTWAHFVPLDGHASPPALPASSSVSISAPGRWQSQAASGWMLHLRTVIMATTRDVLPTPLHVPPTTSVFGPLHSCPMFLPLHRSHTNCCVTPLDSRHGCDTPHRQTASLIITHQHQLVGVSLLSCLCALCAFYRPAFTYGANFGSAAFFVWPPCPEFHTAPLRPAQAAASRMYQRTNSVLRV